MVCLNGVVSDWVGCIMQLRKCSEVRSLYIEGLNNVMVRRVPSGAPRLYEGWEAAI